MLGAVASLLTMSFDINLGKGKSLIWDFLALGGGEQKLDIVRGSLINLYPDLELV